MLRFQRLKHRRKSLRAGLRGPRCGLPGVSRLRSLYDQHAGTPDSRARRCALLDADGAGARRVSDRGHQAAGFLLRGLEAVRSEWTLLAVAFNLRTLAAAGRSAPLATPRPANPHPRSRPPRPPAPAPRTPASTNPQPRRATAPATETGSKLPLQGRQGSRASLLRGRCRRQRGRAPRPAKCGGGSLPLSRCATAPPRGEQWDQAKQRRGWPPL